MIALYIRLSEADADVGEEKEESNSVANQRALLHAFIRKHPELRNEDVEEFVDDGYSGTSSERPAFLRMIALVKQHVIHAVIVKDFSRFGRNYIEVGDYIERIFPFMGVRFLSVNDGYDSKLYPVGSEKDLEIIIRNVFNAYYSRDLSGKIISSIQTRLNQGKYVYASRAFGYLEDAQDGTKIVVDPEAGQIVRAIFDMAIGGMRVGMITDCLNASNVPTCGQYNEKKQIRGKKKPPVKSAYQYWTAEKVIRILKNPVYKGTFVSSKYKRIVPGINKSRKRTEEEQTVFLHHHEPIVSDEEFERAQGVLRGKHAKPVPPYKQYPLKGKIICANCGRVMQYHERKVLDCFYTCPMPEQIRQRSGCSGERYEEAFVNAYVLAGWKKELAVLCDLEQQLMEKESRRRTELIKLEKHMAQLAARLRALQEEKLEIYETYNTGRSSREAFLKKREELLAAVGKEQAIWQKAEEQKRLLLESRRKGIIEFEQLLKRMREFQNQMNLTKSMTDVFLKQLIVHSPLHMEIRWSWEELVKELTEDGDGP